MKKFKQFFVVRKKYLTEGEMLDISILNIDAVQSKVAGMLDIQVVVTEKTDGTKLTLVRNDKPYNKQNWKDNWIVAYKNNILYPEDFQGFSTDSVSIAKKQSIGISQYKFVFDLLEKAHSKCSAIPTNTEFFLEFIMRKPTLTREYTRYHNLILLAASPTQYKEFTGRLYTKSGDFDTSNRKAYADILGVDVPAILFKGKLKDKVRGTNPTEIVKELKDLFLAIPSAYGGVSEGVVLEFQDGTFVKILQDDQHSKTARSAIKQKHAPKNAESYYKKVKELAAKVLSSIGKSADLKQSLQKASEWIYGDANTTSFEGLDENKATINAKDDVFFKVKTAILRNAPGNNNALFIGRFSPLTIAHHNIIKNAIEKYDHVTVNVVKSKIDEQNPFPIDIQFKMLKACFGDKIEIISSNTGNLLTVLQKPRRTINVVLAGTDRFYTYSQQLKDNDETTVVEIPRVDDVSGTKVRNAIKNNDKRTFEANTPTEIHDMFMELQAIVNS